MNASSPQRPIAGQGLDSVVFITIAFAGQVPGLWHLLWVQQFAKVLYEVAVTPGNYAMVGWLTRKTRIDRLNHDVSLNPIGLAG